MLSEARKAKAKRGEKRGKPLTDYGLQLIEKQKIRYAYGITERQFYNYVNNAMKSKGVAPALKLFEELETRLDNTLYRLGVAATRRAARQMVSHGHIMVGVKKMKVPSYQVKMGDKIKIREGSKSKGIFTELSKKLKNYITPSWLKFDSNTMEAEIKGMPKELDPMFEFNTVLEFYSR